MNPVYFPSASEFRAWLERNHATVRELWIGFYKKASGKSGMTYKEAVDEALCYGWIDGIIKRVDADRYTHRFTPRRPGSIWSSLNVRHVQRLTAAGKMHAAGISAFAARENARTGIYSFETKKPAKFPPAFERQFRANRKAWAFFTAQAPGYQRLATHLVSRPKQEATRKRWLERLIAISAAGRKFDPMKSVAQQT